MGTNDSSKSILDSIDDADQDALSIAVGVICTQGDLSKLADSLATEVRGFETARIASDKVAGDALGKFRALIVECRVLEGFEDVATIRAARRARPLMPIFALSVNLHPDFVVAAMEAGASDFSPSNIRADVLGAKIKALTAMAGSARLMELQNEELVRSLKSLRREMAEREKAEAERKVAQDLAHESAKLASLGEMAGSIAHEVKTPLAIVTGNISMLKEMQAEGTAGSDLAKEMLVDIEKMADRINSIIRGLKSFSRHGDADPYELTPMSEIVRDTLALCDEVMEREGVRLIVEEAPDLQIECQATQISQILLNLLTNSRHAVTGKPDAWVKVATKDLGQVVEMTVEDSGPGIPMELREKIFLPFFTTKPKGLGTGLGLSISTKIAVAHGGSLTLDTSVPHTRFVMRVAKQHAKA